MRPGTNSLRQGFGIHRLLEMKPDEPSPTAFSESAAADADLDAAHPLDHVARRCRKFRQTGPHETTGPARRIGNRLRHAGRPAFQLRFRRHDRRDRWKASPVNNAVAIEDWILSHGHADVLKRESIFGVMAGPPTTKRQILERSLAPAHEGTEDRPQDPSGPC
jgi:hypothetical protein